MGPRGRKLRGDKFCNLYLVLISEGRSRFASVEDSLSAHTNVSTLVKIYFPAQRRHVTVASVFILNWLSLCWT